MLASDAAPVLLSGAAGLRAHSEGDPLGVWGPEWDCRKAPSWASGAHSRPPPPLSPPGRLPSCAPLSQPPTSFVFYDCPSQDVGSTLHPTRSHLKILKSITSAKTQFPVRPRSQVPRGRMWTLFSHHPAMWPQGGLSFSFSHMTSGSPSSQDTELADFLSLVRCKCPMSHPNPGRRGVKIKERSGSSHPTKTNITASAQDQLRPPHPRTHLCPGRLLPSQVPRCPGVQMSRCPGAQVPRHPGASG